MTALAAVETNSVAQGFLLADEAVKTADVTLLDATAICAGKFLALWTGSPAAVRGALDSARLTAAPGLLFQELYLARVHDDVVRALAGDPGPADEALGLFESFSALDALHLGDAVAKRCPVRLLEFRLGRGLGGKSTLSFCGSVAAVEEAVAMLREEAGRDGVLSDVLVIPNPSAAARCAALSDGPGHACRSCGREE